MKKTNGFAGLLMAAMLLLSGGAKALAVVDGKIVAARQDNQLVTAFHPELDEDTRLHELFLQM